MNQQNKFVRFILRVMDVLAAGYILRRVHWDKDPYQKATEPEKSSGGLFMVLFPIGFYILLKNTKSLDAWMNSMMYGRHSIAWLYVAWIGVACLGVFIMLKIGPKIPLFISVPIAVVAWPTFLWWGWTR